ncbi:hypothetical protein R1sor_016995 [Riccia sorocarpa]|uniref:Rhodanese domain-containing protein n=1 Tax=Riccia sorocarpa TaxID=122646 RepID=A0ABD3I5I6_9MARC
MQAFHVGGPAPVTGLSSSSPMLLSARGIFSLVSSKWSCGVVAFAARRRAAGGVGGRRIVRTAALRMGQEGKGPSVRERSGISTCTLVRNSISVDGGDCGNEDRGAAAPSKDDKAPSCLVVVSFYKFADLPDYADMRVPLREVCEAHRVSGGVILAPEGINGSICGTRESLEKVFAYLESDVRFKNMRKTEAPATQEDEDIHDGHSEKSPLGAGDDAPFRWGHVRVKLKSEVVPLGVPGVKPSEKVGKYVKPKDWNALISDPDTVTIDVRNDYEIRIGRFKGAVDPETQAFREFPAWVESRFSLENESSDKKDDQPVDLGAPNLPDSVSRDSSASTFQPKRIAMYCTGGIRCEKATSYFIEKGFDEVYHLEGGILKYLEEVPAEKSLWQGECFVFDKRVSVEHGLKQGTYGLCYGCKKPISDEDKEHPLYEEGVSCAYCYHLKTEGEKDRARARQKQAEMFGVIGGPNRGKRPTKEEGQRSLESRESAEQRKPNKEVEAHA